MNRRDFLNYLGLGTATLMIAPEKLLPAPADAKAVEVFTEYPRLYFTGLKASQMNTDLAGQFLWVTEWVGKDGVPGMTHWFTTVKVGLYDVRGPIARDILRARLQEGTLTVAKLMDQIVVDAHRGEAQNGKYHQMPNPKFRLDVPETTAYDDDYEVWNPRYVNGNPVVVPIQSLKFRAFDGSNDDAWDFWREADKAYAQWDRRVGV